MPYTKVRLSKSVQPDELEKILIETAEELGYRAKLTEETLEHYELGSVKKVEEYFRTNLSLKKWGIPLMKIGFDEHKPNNELTLMYGSNYGFATRGIVEKYLSAVSERL